MNPPWTIWRSCFIELWRLVILSSLFLVTVLAFAAAVRFIAKGSLGPIDTLIFMSWAILPMLQYALPFAGGFGATLAYHRMAQDNELVAAGGGGVSHRAILVPAFASGILLAAILMFLTSEVIPGFLQRMERMAVRDVSRLVLSSLESGQPLTLSANSSRGATMIHADAVRALGPDHERGVYERFSLTGVAAIEVDDDGRIISEATASSAIIAFAQVAAPASLAARSDAATAPSITYVFVELRNAFRSSERDGNTVRFATLPFHRSFPQVLRDKPKYLSNRELVRLPDNPDRLNHIDNTRRDLASRIAEGQAIRDLSASLQRDGRVDLVDPDGRIYALMARGIEFNHEDESWTLLPLQPGGRIEVHRYSPAQGAALSGTRFDAGAATLSGDSIKEILDRRVALSLTLHEVRGRGPAAEAAGELPERTFPRLSPPQDPLHDLLPLPSRDLISEARLRIAEGHADPAVLHTADKLDSEIQGIEREVVSRLHERWGSSAAGLIMVLAGALTAMRLGPSLPLTVYLWSFFPALFAVLTISAGQHITQKMGEFGLLILWGGVGSLALYTLGAFLLVRRH